MRLVKGLLAIIFINILLTVVAFVGAQQTEDDKPSPIDIHRIPQTRGMRFVVADKWDKTNLTFRTINCPVNLDCASAQEAIRRAFADWQAVSGLSFSETGGSADIELSFTTNDPEFGTEGDVLAFAYFPSEGGDVFFDDAEPWTLYDGGDTDFYVVALHEIGHSLGLDHSDDPSAVMYAFSGTAPTLQRDDILAIQRLYGTPTSGGDTDTDTNPPTETEIPPLPTPEILPPEDDGGVVETDGDIVEELGYEEWVVYAEAGETLTITMESAELDSYLILLSPDSSEVLAEDDDSLGDFNAVIVYTFDETGDYIIIATTYDGWISGDYSLNVYADGGDISDEDTTTDEDTTDQDVTDEDMTDYTGSYVFTVVNFSGDDVCGVYISSSYAEDWGGNLVGDVLGDGGSVSIELPADDYDVYVYDCYEGGMEWQEYYIPLTSNLSYVVSPDGGSVSK
ncbi:MAG: matrixin family metalloprotease [bacterium]|nr:matrixin family metalloprotease [bacterium]